jgi:hypothetical protein
MSDDETMTREEVPEDAIILQCRDVIGPEGDTIGRVEPDGYADKGEVFDGEDSGEGE